MRIAAVLSVAMISAAGMAQEAESVAPAPQRQYVFYHLSHTSRSLTKMSWDRQSFNVVSSTIFAVPAMMAAR